jgi:hypothetical protein
VRTRTSLKTNTLHGSRRTQRLTPRSRRYFVPVMWALLNRGRTWEGGVAPTDEPKRVGPAIDAIYSSGLRDRLEKAHPDLRNCPDSISDKRVGPSRVTESTAAPTREMGTGRATRGTWTTRCPGHPAEATPADHEADAVGRRVVIDREEQRVARREVTHITTGIIRRSCWPWRPHGPVKMLSKPVVALFPLTVVPTSVKALPLL